MPNRKWCAAVIVSTVMSACQTWGPTWSELTGARHTVVDPNREAAILIRAGNQTIGPGMPFRLEPGKYDIQVQSPVHNGFSGSIKTISRDVEPCRRYYINAQFKDRVGPDWAPVVDYVETIPGCRVPGG